MKIEFPILEIGSVGVEVYIMQALLKYWNYNISLTGAFDTATFLVLKAFRTDHYLTGDTVCDSLTWKALFNY